MARVDIEQLIARESYIFGRIVPDQCRRLRKELSYSQRNTEEGIHRLRNCLALAEVLVRKRRDDRPARLSSNFDQRRRV